MNDRRGLRCSCGLALLTVNSDNKLCGFASLLYSGTPDDALTREPLRRGIKIPTKLRCLHCRCGTVTLTANPHLAFVRAVSAPACRHRSRQPPLRLKMITGVCLPQSPRPFPSARPPSLPKRGCAGIGNNLLATLEKPGRRLQVLFAGPRPVALTRPLHRGARAWFPSEDSSHAPPRLHGLLL